MGVIGWTWLFVVGSFLLYVGVAVWTKATSAADFYVADSAVNPVANGMATGTDWMSAASFMSMAGLAAVMGRDGSVYLIGWTGGYVLLAVLLAPYLRKYGKYTVPQFVGDRNRYSTRFETRPQPRLGWVWRQVGHLVAESAMMIGVRSQTPRRRCC